MTNFDICDDCGNGYWLGETSDGKCESCYPEKLETVVTNNINGKGKYYCTSCGVGFDESKIKNHLNDLREHVLYKEDVS